MAVQQKLAKEKFTQQDLEQSLWKAADILRGAVKPEKYGSYMLPLLFYKRLSDVWEEEFEQALKKYKKEEAAKQKFVHRFIIPDGCFWDDVRKATKNQGQNLNEALEKIAKANPELEGVINRTDFNKQDEIPQDRLIKLIEHFSPYKLGNANVAPDVLGNAYEYLLKQFNEIAPQRAGEFYTPREVVKIMVQILDPDEGDEVYDPCCGTGGMLIFSHYHVTSKGKNPKKLFLCGQELNPDTLTIAKMNVVLHGLEAEVRQGDTIADPRFLDGAGLKKFNIAIANPMWSQDGYRQLMQNDRFGRFNYGIPPNNAADWGWIQHMLASLESDGRIGIVLDQGALFRGGIEGGIRKKVLEDDLIECVVALPDRIFYNTSAPGCLIFLNEKKQADRKKKVIFIYAAKDFEKLKNMNRLRDQDIAKIVETYHNFSEKPKYATVVSLDTIRENNYNLSVTRYVEAFEDEDAIDVASTWQQLKTLETSRQVIEEKLRNYIKELGYES
jgi:type I restriction enzyme M protein